MGINELRARGDGEILAEGGGAFFDAGPKDRGKSRTGMAGARRVLLRKEEVFPTT